MASLYQVKNGLEQVYKVLDNVEEGGGKPDGLNASLRDAFKTELMEFLLYLSSSDGHVSQSERDFINELFDMKLSNNDCVDLINENEIYSTKFESTLPLTLRITTVFDKKMQVVSSVVGQSIDAITPAILKFYAGLGEMFTEIDGNSTNEKKDLEIYIHNIIMGVKQLLDGRRESDLEEKTSIVEGNDEISKELRENTTKNEIGRKAMYIEFARELKRNTDVMEATFRKHNLKILQFSYQPYADDDADCEMLIEIGTIKDENLTENVRIKVNLYNEYGELYDTSSGMIVAEDFDGYDTLKIHLYNNGRTLIEAKSARVYLSK